MATMLTQGDSGEGGRPAESMTLPDPPAPGRRGGGPKSNPNAWKG